MKGQLTHAESAKSGSAKVPERVRSDIDEALHYAKSLAEDEMAR